MMCTIYMLNNSLLFSRLLLFDSFIGDILALCSRSDWIEQNCRYRAMDALSRSHYIGIRLHFTIDPVIPVRCEQSIYYSFIWIRITLASLLGARNCHIGSLQTNHVKLTREKKRDEIETSIAAQILHKSHQRNRRHHRRRYQRRHCQHFWFQFTNASHRFIVPFVVIQSIKINRIHSNGFFAEIWIDNCFNAQARSTKHSYNEIRCGKKQSE